MSRAASVRLRRSIGRDEAGLRHEAEARTMAARSGTDVAPRVAAALLALLLGAGCGGAGATQGTPCVTTDDCPAGQICVDGRCLSTDGGHGDGEGGGGDGDLEAGDGDGDGDGAADGDEDVSAEADVSAETDAPAEAEADAGDGDGPDGDGDGDGDATCVPEPEVCGTGVDEDCDGETDEAECGCARGTVQACYSGPPGTVGTGICRTGARICVATGEWTECAGEVVPLADPETACDGRDEDCDGDTDEALRNDCGGCGPVPEDECGNSLDDDCDTSVDEDCICDPDCRLPDPSSCRPPADQPCYEGSPATLGFGRCRGGVHDCVYAGGVWSWTTCAGQVLPGVECDGGLPNGEDDDCDGATDEGCLADVDGDGFAAPADCDDGNGDIHPGAAELCDGLDNDCDGIPDEGVRNACGGCGAPGVEACNGLDDDCDGAVDEDCDCVSGDEQACYSGPAGTEANPPCSPGTQVCPWDDQYWGPCEGEVLPGVEVCDGVDNDCDGATDERFAVGANPCGDCVFDEACDGLDNDCDGLTDEGVRNVCGQCLPVPPEALCDGDDDDCDGLVDEGLLNACGLCPPNECYVDTWTDEEDWDEGSGTGVSTHPANPLHDDCRDPGTVCLDSTITTLRHIWVPNSASATLAKIDVDTGAMEAGFPRGALGTMPSRTVVDPRDGSVWLGNRGDLSDSGIYMNGEYSNVVHFAADGSIICRTPLPGMVRAVTLDAEYNVWAGLWGTSEIVKISGTGMSGGPPPVCSELARYSAGGRPYGAAGDAYGSVWFALNANWANSFAAGTQSLLRVPTGDPTRRTQLVPPSSSVGDCFNTYGIAVDSLGRVWIGSYACGTVIRYTPSTDTWNFISMGGWGTPRGVALDALGTAYVALSNDGGGNTNRVARIPADLSTYAIIDLGPSALHPVGTAIDHAGRVWTVQRLTNNACRVDVSAWPAYTVDCYSTGGSDPYAYTDMTGLQQLLHTAPTGIWTVDFDSGYPDAYWARVEWASFEVPGVTDVSVRARTAPDRAGLGAGTWSAGYTDSPALLRADPLVVNPNRWIQVEVTMTTTDPRQTPVLYSLSVSWEH
jgi:streptogramin lyase